MINSPVAAALSSKSTINKPYPKNVTFVNHQRMDKNKVKPQCAIFSNDNASATRNVDRVAGSFGVAEPKNGNKAVTVNLSKEIIAQQITASGNCGSGFEVVHS
tara:strand:+ start:1797 stop:2105 length:309 start_codon:yes stop_codon:yes gene_type:complete